MDTRDISKVSKGEQYQLPTFEEISTRLAGVSHFSKFDANKGYWQIPLDAESFYLTSMNTPFSRYRLLRLPFGIHKRSNRKILKMLRQTVIFYNSIYSHIN